MTRTWGKKTDVSVIVCTYNRGQQLSDVLNDLAGQETQDAFVYEVLVVDNNSKDKTREVVVSFHNRFKGRLRYLFETRQGRSYALNRGIQEADGDIIVPVDDDCSLEGDYLINVYRNFQIQPSSVGMIGGKILPQWMKGLDSQWLDKVFNQPAYHGDGSVNWIKINFEGPLGILDYGSKPLLIDGIASSHDKRRFYGANMAFRKGVFLVSGFFIGTRFFCEDAEIFDRILRCGFKGLYDPRVTIRHKIFRSRYSVWFYYWYYFRRGLSMEHQEPYQKKFYHPLGVSLTLVQKTARLFLKSREANSGPLEKAFYRCRALFHLGQILQIAKRHII